jgi:hypothetical protein
VLLVMVLFGQTGRNQRGMGMQNRFGKSGGADEK